MISFLISLLLAFGDPSVTPRPIGVDARYHPAPASHAVRRGARVGTLRCTRGDESRYGVHIEMFARRSVVIVPAGVGVASPFAARFGTVQPRGCSYPLRTRTPTGIVEVRSGAKPTLGDFFSLWGQPLTRHRLAGFRSARPLLAFVGGRRWRGDPRTIPLAPHAQIVLELGGFVPPHRQFLFPKGL